MCIRDSLKRMLGNVKTRGVWGEIQLGALLEQALTDTQYPVSYTHLGIWSG